MPTPSIMKLTGGDPYWLIKSGLVGVAPPLDKSTSCDVVVVGSGITGALIADSLAATGCSVIVLDRRDLANGSTTASTALLQYEIDVPLIELRELIGREQADRAYHLGVEAIDMIRRTAEGVGISVPRRSSLYFARSEESLAFLRREADVRRRAGFQVDIVDEYRLAREWGLVAHGAILSHGAAEVDPYLLAHSLLAAAMRHGARLYDRTAVERIEPGDTSVLIETDRGHTVTASWAILATGYESQSCLPEKIVDLHSTYAIVTEPCCASPVWPDRALLWEYAEPYVYARTTLDNRVIIGGEDEEFKDAAARDALIPAKSKVLFDKLKSLLPGKCCEVAFAWAGTFGRTKDGLGYIGPPTPGGRVLCALGFGGNGITFGAIGARMLTRLVKGENDPDQHLFRFGR